MTRQRRDREAPEIGSMARRVVRALRRRAEGGDTEALEQLLLLADEVDAQIRAAGRGLHRFGYSYTELANVTGTTRQAARARFQPTEETTDD